MAKVGLFRHIPGYLLLLLSLQLTAGCATLKEVIWDEGFIPLERFEMVQLVSPTGAIEPNQTILGRTIVWKGLSAGPTPTLRPGINAIQGFPKPIEVILSRGPRKILNKARAETSLNSQIAAGSFGVNLGLTGSAGQTIDLNNLYLGSLTFNEPEQVNYFIRTQSAEENEHDDLFLITTLVAADVSNCESVGIKVDVMSSSVPEPKPCTEAMGQNSPQSEPLSKPYPFSFQLEGGATSEIKGPGLVLGVKGIRIHRSNHGKIPSFFLPTTESPMVRVPIPIRGKSSLTLTVSRLNDENVEFKLPDLPTSMAWVQNIMGIYEQDRFPTRDSSVAVAKIVPFASEEETFNPNEIGLSIIPTHTKGSQPRSVNLALTYNSGTSRLYVNCTIEPENGTSGEFQPYTVHVSIFETTINNLPES